jgi:preprotein translocase subunit YajC
MIESAFAQTAAGTAPAAGSPLGALISFMPFILIMVLFYFLMIHPQNKERKKREEMLKAIQRGDKVLTRGGVYGVVADIKENTLIVKISENNKVEVERSYIDSVQKS